MKQLLALAGPSTFLCVALFFAMPVAAADQMHCPATAPTLKVSPSKNPKYQNITGHFCGYFWGIVSLDIADLGNGKFKVEFIYPKYLNSPEYMDATYDAHIDSSGKLTFETFANNRSATVTVWADSSSVYGHYDGGQEPRKVARIYDSKFIRP